MEEPRPKGATHAATAAIYCRISDDREGREVGVLRQEEDCRALAERHGYEVPDDLVFIENDVGASTRSRKSRPKFEAMMRAARHGEFVAILAYSNSRLTRRPMEVEDVIRLHEQTGVRVRTVVSGDDDLSTADGRMVARIKGNVDAAEAERISERVSRARKQAMEEGRFRGGPRPYGFEKDGTTIVPKEAEVIRWLTDQVIEGRSVRALIQELNSRGIKSSSGKKWASNNLRDVILRPRNAGLISTGQRSHGNFVIHEHKAVWDAIVPEEKWRAAFDKLTDTSRRTNHGANSLTWLGSGIYRCGVPTGALDEAGQPVLCGGPMRVTKVGGTESRPSPPRTMYRCGDRAHLLLTQTWVDEYVLETVAAAVRDPRIIEALTPKGVDQAPDREELGVLRRRLDRTERDYDDDLIDARRFRIKSEKIKAEIQVIEKRMAKAVERSASLPIVGALDPGQAFLDAPMDIQRAVIATVVKVTALPAPEGSRGKRLTRERVEQRVRIEPVVTADAA